MFIREKIDQAIERDLSISGYENSLKKQIEELLDQSKEINVSTVKMELNSASEIQNSKIFNRKLVK